MIDLRYTSDFDLELDRDFAPASQLERDVQLLKVRLTGNNPDFTLHKDMCASMEEFIGEDNTQSTGQKITDKINYSLTHDGAFSASNLSVDAYPSDYNEIQANIEYKVPSTGKSQFIYETQVVKL